MVARVTVKVMGQEETREWSNECPVMDKPMWVHGTDEQTSVSTENIDEPTDTVSEVDKEKIEWFYRTVCEMGAYFPDLCFSSVQDIYLETQC